jgi:carboxyl-terminal processing protease
VRAALSPVTLVVAIVGVILSSSIDSVRAAQPTAHAVHEKTLREVVMSLASSSVEPIARETLVEAGLRALSRDRPCLERSRSGGKLFLRCLSARQEHDWPPSTDRAVADLLTSALALAHASDDVQPQTVQHIARALALSAGDPYTTYISPTEVARFMPGRGTVFGTTGLGLSPRDPTLVRDVRPGSDAEARGLARGDRVLYIDDQPTTGMSYADMLSRLAGQAGTVVRLVVKRAGGDEKTFMLARSHVPEARVSSESLPGEMLYVRVATFSRGVAAEVKQEIYDNQCRGVVLDLRQNDGGLIEEGIALLDLFFSTGSLGGTRPRAGRSKSEWTAKHDATDLNVPLVILVDGGSASASELVTLVMQERGRALILGSQTMGKGSVQQPIALPDGGILRVTMAHYTGADGQRLDQDGIPPHVYLPPPRGRTVLSGAPASRDPWVLAALDALDGQTPRPSTTARLGPMP